jgi:hypothetical protein
MTCSTGRCGHKRPCYGALNHSNRLATATKRGDGDRLRGQIRYYQHVRAGRSKMLGAGGGGWK